MRKQRWLSVLLALVLILGTFPTAALATEEVPETAPIESAIEPTEESSNESPANTEDVPQEAPPADVPSEDGTPAGPDGAAKPEETPEVPPAGEDEEAPSAEEDEEAPPEQELPEVLPAEEDEELLTVTGGITPTAYEGAITPGEALSGTLETIQKITPVVGSTNGEWAVLAAARQLGPDGLSAAWKTQYLSALASKLNGSLDNLDTTGYKHTEFSRVALALSALGIDASAAEIGGNTYDFTAKLANESSAKSQGINGVTFALIALDAKPYLPDNTEIRDAYIAEILRLRRSDGGWASTTSASKSEVDMTAMVLQALAPYYGRADIKAVADDVLAKLSTFSFSGSESHAQTIVALTALADENSQMPEAGSWTVRGVTFSNPVQELLAYYDESLAGFRHVAGTPSTNQMATEQGAYALAAYDRWQNGKTSLYDMSDLFSNVEDSELVKNQAAVAAAKAALEAMNWDVDMVAVSNASANVKSYVQKTAENAAGSGISVSKVTIKPFKAAAAGSGANPAGTEGSYTAAIELTKGEGDALATETASVTAKILPTAFDGTISYPEVLNQSLGGLLGTEIGTGTSKGEWMIFTAARQLGPDGLDAAWKAQYLAALSAKLNGDVENLDTSAKKTKYTEYSRVALALTSLGIDASAAEIGGTTYDFIAKLLETEKVTAQGINGTSYALLALDAKPYLPDNTEIRDTYIAEILAKQIASGGWGYGTRVDMDLTSMTLQALVPYYEKNADVKTAVDKALAARAGLTSTTAENYAQLVVALTSLAGPDDLLPAAGDWTVRGVTFLNPVQDLLQYYEKNSGRFYHALNSTLNINQVSIQISTEQSVYALVAYDRQQKGKTGLYDMSDLFSGGSGTLAENQAAVAAAKAKVEALSSWDVSMGTANTKEDVAAHIRTAVAGAAAGVSFTVEVTKFQAAVGGAAGTAGSYTAKITLSKGEGASWASEELIVTGSITPTGQQPEIPPDPSGKITVEFTLLGDVVHDKDANGRGDPNANGGPHLYAKNNLTEWIAKTSYEVDQNATVKDVFEKALTENHLTWSNPSGNYVESITRNGATLGEFTNGVNSGWKYLLNGVYSDKGVSEQTLEDEDKIVFHYTDDHTQDNGAVEPDKITVAFTLLGDKAHADPNAEGGPHSLRKDNLEEWIARTEFTAESNATVLDVFEAALSANGITWSNPTGTYVESITRGGVTLAGGTNGPNSGWMYNLNGTAPALGVNQQTVKDRDEIVYYYTDDWNIEFSTAPLYNEVLNQALTTLQNGAVGVGSTKGEWAVLAAARQLGPDGLSAAWKNQYLTALAAKLNGDLNNLDPSGFKYTEYARVTLALTALGIDASAAEIGGRTYDFTAKLVEQDNVTSQGVNGTVFALLALDSKPYLPDNTEIRDAYIAEILAKRLPDGGWDIENKASDPDMTAMALQALAPYYGKNAGVKAAADKALALLAGLTFTTSESYVQTIVALTALAEQKSNTPETGDWTVRGVTFRNPVEALLRYYDEGSAMFRHELGGQTNQMATEQGAYALAAYDRQQKGKTSLYDMTDLFSGGSGGTLAENRAAVVAAKAAVSALSWTVPMDTVKNSREGVETYVRTAAAGAAGGVSFTVEITAFQAAVSGSASNPDGTAGSYSAKIVLTKGEGAALASEELSVTGRITPKAYQPELPPSGTITVSFTLLGDVHHTDPNSSGGPHTLKKNNLRTWISRRDVTVPAGSTVFDVFCRVLDAEGYTYVGASSNYVETITSPSGVRLSEFSNGKFSGWMYTLNGDHPEQGLQEQTVKNGDSIVWHYTDDYTVERGSEKWSGENNNAVLKPGEAASVAVEITETKDSATAKVTEKGLKDAIADAKQSGTDTIKIEPNVKGKDKVTVQLPKDTTLEIVNQTDAELQIKTEHASATISQEGLKDLAGRSGGTVSVTMEAKKDGGTAISVAVGGKNADKIAGGLAVTVPADKVSAGNVLVLVSADGTETVIKKSVADGKNVKAVVDGSCTVKVVDNGKRFADTQDHWAEDAVAFVTSHELFNGTSGDSFSPDRPMTRAMLAAVLYRLEGAAASGGGGFGDVKSGDWCAEAVAWASQEGIVTGYGDGNFQPNRNVNREQLAAMLYRYAKTLGLDNGARGNLNNFTDGAKISSYARDAMEWAVGNGLISGKTDGSVDPSGSATRAQVATILQRMVELMAR